MPYTQVVQDHLPQPHFYLAELLLLWNLGKETLTGDERLDVVEYQQLHLALSVLGLSAHVREKCDVVHCYELGVDVGLIWEDIQASRVEMSRLESLDQCLLVDHTAARSVDEDGSCLHLRKLLATERVACLIVEREVEGDNIALAQEFLYARNVRAGEIWGWYNLVAVVVDHLHVEGDETAGHGRSNTSHSDDTKSLSIRVESGDQTRLPLAVSNIHFGTVELTQGGDGEPSPNGSSSGIDCLWSMRNIDSTSRRGGNVDLVVPSPVMGN